MCRSVRQTPQARTRRSRCPGTTCGRGVSSITSGVVETGCADFRMAAFMKRSFARLLQIMAPPPRRAKKPLLVRMLQREVSGVAAKRLVAAGGCHRLEFANEQDQGNAR